MTPYRHITLTPITGQTFFVGDIHGQYTELMEQLNRIGFDFNHDRLISVGDLIDRGNETVECLNMLQMPWFYSVLGNHEGMFLLSEQDVHLKHLHLGNGGEWIEDHTLPVLTLLKQLIVNKMPLTLTVTTQTGHRIGVVHATTLNNSWPETATVTTQEQAEFILWNFNKANRVAMNGLVPKVEGVDAVVSGHLTTHEVIVGQNHLWIDTKRTGQPFKILSEHQVLELAHKT